MNAVTIAAIPRQQIDIKFMAANANINIPSMLALAEPHNVFGLSLCAGCLKESLHQLLLYVHPPQHSHLFSSSLNNLFNMSGG